MKKQRRLCKNSLLKQFLIGRHPIIQDYIERLKIFEILRDNIKQDDRLCLDCVKVIVLMIYNFLTFPKPLYELSDWLTPIDEKSVGLGRGDSRLITDDRAGIISGLFYNGRHKDSFFRLALRAIKTFDLDYSRVHQDTMIVTLIGKYSGWSAREKFTYGHKKDHRPDLKQFVLGLSVSGDGTVPMYHNIYNGSQTDDKLHIRNHQHLQKRFGRTDFISVADCKLATGNNLRKISSCGGLFVSVMPQTWKEDRWFRKSFIDGKIFWKHLLLRKNNRKPDSKIDRYYLAEGKHKTSAGYSLLWIRSTQKAEQDKITRMCHINSAVEELNHIQCRPNKYNLKLGCRQILEKGIDNARYAAAIKVLIKNIFLKPAALYRIPQWSKQFDSEAIGLSNRSDDVIGRSLDKLFRAQRATIQTELTLRAVKTFQIDVSQIHNDSTTVKFYGPYKTQGKKALQLKRCHSKDLRPDHKQLFYNLSISRDGAIPIHFKAYDGNRTDDTLHIETWHTLRGMLRCQDFLYVADSKLCTNENMNTIGRNQGRFVTIVSETRAETKNFSEKCYTFQVRWEPCMRRPSTRKKGTFDVFFVADDFYQLSEGYRLYWYRSSKKKKRDKKSREERIATAIQKLEELNQKRPRGRRTTQSLKKNADAILDRLKVKAWLNVNVTVCEEESFIKISRGKRTEQATYRRIVKDIPELVVTKNHEQIARTKAMDGIFPLTTNTSLTAKEVLEAYKYQPHIEKRFSGLKSDFTIAPAFLKKTERVEALMFTIYIADLVAALIQKELKRAMGNKGIQLLKILPENRPTKTPTWEQVQRLFAQHSKYELSQGDQLVKTFWDELTKPQQQVCNLLPIPQTNFVLMA